VRMGNILWVIIKMVKPIGGWKSTQRAPEKVYISQFFCNHFQRGKQTLGFINEKGYSIKKKEKWKIVLQSIPLKSRDFADMIQMADKNCYN
jgi:hypothetical protein